MKYLYKRFKRNDNSLFGKTHAPFLHADSLTAKKRARRAFAVRRGLLLSIALLGTMALAIYYEAKTSNLQSRWLSRYADSLTYAVEEGPSDAIRFPDQGPFDNRLGYSRLPAVIDRLVARGMVVERQARFSPELLRYTEAGFFPPYREKTQAGLSILDHRHEPIYRFLHPRQVYGKLEDIPEPIVNTLLFIENRHLLESDSPRINPTIEWQRLAKAALFQVGERINIDTPSVGGSTLATQIEKFRHSDEGKTDSVEEKWRQMVSASVRVYRQGELTLPARRQLVVDYLNSVPLAAAGNFGEVNGLSDGLHVFFGADFAAVNRLLHAPVGEGELLEQQARAFRQVLALMLAQRRPSYYLVVNRQGLAALTDSYLRVLRRGGVIDPTLATAALTMQNRFRDTPIAPEPLPTALGKGVNMVRNWLVSSLDMSAYELNRMDMTAVTTLDGPLQAQVSHFLRELRDPDVAREQGLVGESLLKPGQAEALRYSFTLFQRSDSANVVRVQTDNTDMPFDINEGSKLELGSTAKLRVLTSYLEIIAALHERFAGQSPEALKQLRKGETDMLTVWVLEQLAADSQMLLSDLLQAALDRRYSAGAAERFFTGGGLHRFNNFQKRDNGRTPTLREAFRESINLPFVRLLRDVIRHIGDERWENMEELFQNVGDPRRVSFLNSFIDRESAVYLARFWSKYRNREERERLEAFLLGLKPDPHRLAIIHRYLYPEAEFETFAAFMIARAEGNDLTLKSLRQLYERYQPRAYDLQDMGYLAGVHPLELWLLHYLLQDSSGSFNKALVASQEERRQVYRWLQRTKAKNAQDSRIRTILEVEAFSELHQRWQRLGYPFSHLVPSLATALGSSGDRPASLAELMGIILNDGRRLPIYRMQELRFAEDTPYETRLGFAARETRQVMQADVAAALQSLLAEVVENGTGRRIRGVLKYGGGTAVTVGGKTGTGDNRFTVVGAGGAKHQQRALNRTATFVFYLGEDHFGTLTAFVAGDEARNFQFTSALPVQVLKALAPLLAPHLQDPATDVTVAETPDSIAGRAMDKIMDNEPMTNNQVTHEQ